MAYEGGARMIFFRVVPGGLVLLFWGGSYAFWWAAGAADRGGLAPEGAFLGSYGKVSSYTRR